MTVIAYKDGIIACDSYLVRGSTVVDFTFNKHFKRGQYDIFLCGAVADYDPLIDLIIGGNIRQNYSYDAEALYIFDHKLFHCSTTENDEEFWVRPSRLEEPVTIGSGRDFAYAAMDCGCSAKEAVAVACKRNIYCGGKIRTFKV